MNQSNQSIKHKTNEKIFDLDKVAINVKSFKILRKILKENPYLEEIMRAANSPDEANEAVKAWVMAYFESNPIAYRYYEGHDKGYEAMAKLEWRDYAAIRLLDYVDHAGETFEDPNVKIRKATVNEPVKLLWLAINFGTGGAKPDFFEDLLHLLHRGC